MLSLPSIFRLAAAIEVILPWYPLEFKISDDLGWSRDITSKSFIFLLIFG